MTSGLDSRGSLIGTIIGAAHSYKGDPVLGWTADLLDNKLVVATQFAISLGLTYNSAADSITKGMAIAGAVTPTSTAAAIALVGVNDAIATCRLAATPSSVSLGHSATLTATCAPSPNSYTWTGGSCVFTAGASCVVTPTASSAYTVVGNFSWGASNPASATVTLAP